MSRFLFSFLFFFFEFFDHYFVLIQIIIDAPIYITSVNYNYTLHEKSNNNKKKNIREREPAGILVTNSNRPRMSEGQSVDVATLQPQELQKLRQSLSDDIQLITNNFGNLKVAQARFAQGLEALLDLKPENEGKAMLIPLTGSLYVPGQLADHNKVVVDVGTGYFVEKPVPDARAFIENKLKMIAENIEKVGAALTGKRRDLEAVTMILQSKVSAMRNAQQQQLASQSIEA